MKKKTGELEAFKKIWAKRPHESEVSGELLYRFSPAYFAHVLPKGAYPSYRLKEENIVLMTFEEHQLFDHYTHKAKEDKRFNWVFDLREKLRSQYYEEQL